MIAIDHVLVSDEIIEKHFVCDLNACKGGCCVDGDCGAPLTEEEAKILADLFPKIKHLIPESHVAEIEKQGTDVTDEDYGTVTPTINGGICAYGYIDDQGIVKCAIEKAWQQGLTDFQKPISCHLYPIRVSGSEGYEALNYSPRKKLCRPACRLGKQLKVPVYQFLKAPLIRKYGNSFYEALEAAAREYFENEFREEH